MEGLLKRAVETKDKLEMIYLSEQKSISQRVIRVLKVTDEDIKAYCYTKRQLRSFKLSNILSVAPLKQKRGA